MKSRNQGSANVGMEEKGNFKTGTSTANQNVATEKKNSNKNKKKGRK